MKINFTRNNIGFSLIETMTVLAVIAIVVGLLYAYSEQGSKLFYQSYGRGLSQVKAKLAVRTLIDDLREANKSRITISKGTSYGVPLPPDTIDSSPYIYFTKPMNHEQTGEVIGYDYVLYYFTKPKRKIEDFQRKVKDEVQYLILKSIRFTNQSKYYTEDEEKKWPFLPPILEIQKSQLSEDKAYIASLEGNSQPIEDTEEEKKRNEEFVDYFIKIKKESRNIPISGNFTTSSLTDPFSEEEVNIFFGQEYKSDKPIKIKVSIEESPLLFGLMASMTEFEMKVTPRN